MNTTVDGNATSMTDIHDIKPLLDMGSDLQWLYVLLGVLVLAGLAWLAWHLWQRRKKPVPAVPAPPPVPAHIEALAALDALAAQKDISAKPYYYKLSAILRRYLERRYRFPAAEMTTEELLPQLDRLPLDADLPYGGKTFCLSADPIKFAGMPAGRQQMNAHMELTRHFVDRTAVRENDSPDEAKAPDRSDGLTVEAPKALPGIDRSNV